MDWLSAMFSKKEKEHVLENLVVLVDSREKENSHITDFFDEKGVPWRIETLPFGDYSFAFPYGMEGREIDLRHLFAIERKRNLEELSGNFTADRTRIENEFIRAKSLLLLVENASLHDLMVGNYATQYNAKSFLATLLSWQFRYGFFPVFLPSSDSAAYIYKAGYYYMRKMLQ